METTSHYLHSKGVQVVREQELLLLTAGGRRAGEEGEEEELLMGTREGEEERWL